MYSNDTFFHLSVPGQTGLAFLSLILASVTLWCFIRISSRFGLFVKVLLAFVLIWIFIWLSPQVYYQYYLLLFDGLPLQNVIRQPPSLGEILQTITFTGAANLSNHSKGLLFWMMVEFACKDRVSN